jgi:hypothetical protein
VSLFGIVRAVGRGEVSPEDGARKIIEGRKSMKDPRKLRQTIQSILGIAAIAIPWIIGMAKDNPKLGALVSILGGVLTLITNPRLVAVLDVVMPAAGSSAVKPDAPKATEHDDDKTPVLTVQQPSVRDPGRGSFASVLLLFLLMLAASSALIWGAERMARADAPGPQFGGCFSAGKVCAGPSAAITIASFNLATSQFSGGVSPGLGYGLTYATDQWYAAGIDLYASLRLGTGQPNQATFSIMGHFANYVFLGIGPSITQRDAGQPALVQWSILGGLGVPIGGSTGYVRAAGSK